MADEKNNTGYLNTGNWNTGNWNTGDLNTGYRNTGNLNTGNRNTGYRNTGYRNTGDLNTGNWNTGNWNTGYLNTGDGRVETFGRDAGCGRDEIAFPPFFYHDTAAVWVPLSSMTGTEKETYKTCETVGGYLKKVDPKVGWRTAWDKASDEDRRKCFDIPNWNNEMFKEISGIDVEAELNKPESVELTVADIEKIVGHKVKIVKEGK